MQTGLLHLHSILRWIILLFLLIAFFQALAAKPGVRRSSLFLMICSHLMLLIGMYQLLNGRYGILKGLPAGTELMKDSFYRFFWIEHPLLMIVAIILITLARGKAKVLNYKATAWLYFIALILILAAIPWPFRDVVGANRNWFPGM
jgi:uncharacterized membrane protein